MRAEDNCEVMGGPHCICRERGDDCCWCDVGRANCKDDEDADGDEEGN